MVTPDGNPLNAPDSRDFTELNTLLPAIQSTGDHNNGAASAMKQADPSIKLVALELSDYGQQAEAYLPAFVAGVTAPVDVLATHFYSRLGRLLPFSLAAFPSRPGHPSSDRIRLLSLDQQHRRDAGTGYAHAGGPQSGWVGSDSHVEPRGSEA